MSNHLAACPKCGKDDSFYKWSGSRGDTMGKCYRAKCGWMGSLGVTHTPAAKVRPSRHYTRPYKPLNDDQALLIKALFGLPAEVVDGYSEVDDRFILGVTDSRGYTLGHIAYSLSGAKPKALTYNGHPDKPWMHCAYVTESKAIVVVEDWFSAEKVREAAFTGIAIMGTNLTQAVVSEIAALAYDASVPVFLALDKDAYAKSLKYQAKYKEQFPSGLYVWALDKDLKYESVEKIKNAVETRDFDFSRFTRKQGST